MPEGILQTLLVEGNDDKHVVFSLCQKFNLPENFHVIDCVGYSNLVQQIEPRLLQANVKALGIIVDADVDINQRWLQVKGKFERLGYTLPDDLPLSGCVVNHESKPRIGIWVMPNNNINGCLENFIEFLIPKTDILKDEVKSSLQIINDKGIQYFKEIHYSKAYISTWLAWQADPGTPMGLAITKRFLTTNEVPELDLFIGWLCVLFQ